MIIQGSAVADYWSIRSYNWYSKQATHTHTSHNTCQCIRVGRQERKVHFPTGEDARCQCLYLDSARPKQYICVCYRWHIALFKLHIQLAKHISVAACQHLLVFCSQQLCISFSCVILLSLCFVPSISPPRTTPVAMIWQYPTIWSIQKRWGIPTNLDQNEQSNLDLNEQPESRPKWAAKI